MDQIDNTALVALRRCRNRRDADQYALVLAAAGMNATVMPDVAGATLLVAGADAIRANDELMAYDLENRSWRPKRRLGRLPALRIDVALIYWAVMLFFFAAAANNALSIDWVGIGSARSDAILQGEWWRTATALFLHVSFAHLLANLAFGAVFLALLAQITGPGAALLLAILGGIAGNIVNAFWQGAGHASIGASTAVFAALGTLVAMGQRERDDGRFRYLRRWAPLIGGLTLLIMLGFGGENTDIAAHIFGFFAGLVLGWAVARWKHDGSAEPRLQWISGGIAGAIVCVAWLAAALG